MANKVKFENNAPKVKNTFNNVCEAILVAMGEKAVSLWVKIITQKKVVDTGRFRSSTAWIKDTDKSIQVGSNVEYAPILEVGGSSRPARPTLTPAIMENKETYRKIAENLLKNG